MKNTALVIGGGLVGSLLSVVLAKKGYKVTLVERRPDMRKNRMQAGKSINLALSDRGWKALRTVGLEDAIREIAIPMYHRDIHHLDGKRSQQPYGKNNQAIYSVSRGGINCTLLDLAEQQSNVEMFFGLRNTKIDWNNKTAHFADDNAGKELQIKADLIFGSDGAFSAARLHHQITSDRFDYRQFYIDFGYKELNIPPDENGNFRLDENALHIWPRGNYMMIALPNLDKSFTCTLFFPFDGDPSFSKLKSEKDVLDFFERDFPDALPMMPTLLHDFFTNPTSSLVTVKCSPWIREDYFALIGDAAHAIVPFFGQGMNCGFEDCTVLNGLIEKHNHDWGSIMPEYQQLRKPDGDAIADLAIQNFVEMRDKVADPNFLLRKKIEGRLHDKYPDQWVPAYSMVTFSPEIRYSQALERGSFQDKIMDEVMKHPQIGELWDSETIEQLILSKL
jgi:kynurenine 3-monooxygenase